MTYTTSDKVAGYLQRDVFSTSTIPTKATVDNFISWSEGEIERITLTAWRSIQITEEYHSMRMRRKYRSVWSEPFVRLDHCPVIALDGATDKIEVWNGSSWVDYVASKTEGRGDDFWVNYEDGVIYFKRGMPIIPYHQGVKATYRYGFSSVKGWVEELATMMAGLQVCRFDKHSMVAGGGGSALDKEAINASIGRLEEEIKRRLDEKKWVTTKKRYGIL